MTFEGTQPIAQCRLTNPNLQVTSAKRCVPVVPCPAPMIIGAKNSSFLLPLTSLNWNLTGTTFEEPSLGSPSAIVLDSEEKAFEDAPALSNPFPTNPWEIQKALYLNDNITAHTMIRPVTRYFLNISSLSVYERKNYKRR
mmetsp:Transcript_22680/g.49096  ORF Transcript_22680/g.49096 Transcript_22680/m.49096 type:complete len:140 (-) Transcript_22680:60-479(-)